MEDIQDRRAKVEIPGGRPLHEYANLYLCARNPMLYKRKDRHAELCVLRVSTDVLDLPDVVITDGNASSCYTLFAPAPSGLSRVDAEKTFARYWAGGDLDEIEQWRRKVAKCAEVLVPDRVGPELLTGAYVSCEQSLAVFNAMDVGITATVDSDLFFV